MKKTYVTFAMLAIWATGDIAYSQNRAPVRRGGGPGPSAPSRPTPPPQVNRPTPPSHFPSRPTPSYPSRPVPPPVVSRPTIPSGPVYRPNPGYPNRPVPPPVVTRPTIPSGPVYRPNPGYPNRPFPGRPGGGVIITRPSYPHAPINRPLPGSVYTRIGSGNIVYGGYRDRFGQVSNRLDYMRRDVRIGGWVNVQIGHYRSVYQPHYLTRTSWYNSYYPTWRTHYTNWGRWGFYGGFYWNFRPVADIGIYFYNPMVSWFYSPNYDDYYYNTWYNSGITAYPQLRQPFPYTGVYYPTEEFRDLNLGMSQASTQSQVNYRTAMIDFTLKLQQQVTNILGYGVTLSANDIVITHFQQLNGDTGVVVEGWVSVQQQNSYPFKAYLDLNSGMANLFVTSNNGQYPSQTEIDNLGGLNSQIQNAGGVVEGEDYPDYSNDNPNGEINNPTIGFPQ